MSRPFTVADWTVDPARNRIERGAQSVDLEPKVMDLLVHLSARPGEVVSREALADALWPGVTVNEDALSRTIFKLRRALGDDAKAPRYVETIPKRGVRLIAAVGPVETRADTEPEPAGRVSRAGWLGIGAAALTLAAAGLALAPLLSRDRAPDMTQAEPEDGVDARLRRADAFYMAFTRADNEAAMSLYEGVLAQDPDNAAAMAGLANALTQRMIRFSGPGGLDEDRRSLGEALASGWLDTPEAQASIDRAASLARAATEADPGHARAWRALGLAEAARRDFEASRRAHERALVIEPDDWGALVNLADVSQLTGRDADARAYLIRAFEAMERGYRDDPVAVGAWQSEIGVAVARRLEAAGRPADAELWYRRVLAIDPVNAEAVAGLANLLRASGDAAGAEALCDAHRRRTGEACP
ncbi:MAG: tetratricopeptide repeat protein [Oceanicaulis sp.]